MLEEMYFILARYLGLEICGGVQSISVLTNTILERKSYIFNDNIYKIITKDKLQTTKLQKCF